MDLSREPYGCVYHVDNLACLQSSENILQYFFSFLFLLDLLHKKGVWESVTHHSHITRCHRVISHDEVT